MMKLLAVSSTWAMVACLIVTLALSYYWHKKESHYIRVVGLIFLYAFYFTSTLTVIFWIISMRNGQ